jgi:hypothetical protein
MDFWWAVRRHANATEIVPMPYRAALMLFVVSPYKLPCIIRVIRDIHPVLQSLAADYPISRNCVLRKVRSCVVWPEITIIIIVSNYWRMGVLGGSGIPGYRRRYRDWLWAALSGVLIQRGARYFLFYVTVQTRTGAHPASSTVGAGEVLSWG